MMTAEISLQRTLDNVEDEIDENDDAGRCKSSQIFHKKTKNDDDDDDASSKAVEHVGALK